MWIYYPIVPSIGPAKSKSKVEVKLKASWQSTEVD